MGVIKRLKSLFPIPTQWSEDGKSFARRTEKAYQEFQTHVKIVNYSCDITISANSTGNATKAQLKMSTPKGYVPAGIVSFDTGNTYINVRYISLEGVKSGDNINIFSLRNNSSSSRSVTVSLSVLYVSSACLNN